MTTKRAGRVGNGIETAIARTCFVMTLIAGSWHAVAHADPADAKKEPTAKPQSVSSELPRPVRVAVLDADVLSGIPIEGRAVADQLNRMLAALPKLTIVNRDQIKRVAEEHQVALSGLVDTSSAIKLGKFLSAQYFVVGRVSKIGQTYYIVLKIINVETTEQTTVSTKSPVEDGVATLLERLSGPLAADMRRLQQPSKDTDDEATSELRKLAAVLVGKVVLVAVDETHVNRPLPDPAAELTIMQRLRRLGISVIVPKTPTAGWKETLLETGKYGDRKVDFLLEGEGVSAFAAQFQGLVSCRARVELRLIAVPGRSILTGDRGVAAGVDLIEALAAKTALEEAGAQACDAVLRRAAVELKQAKK